MKKTFFLLILFPFFLSAQNTDGSIEFWKNLQTHCGKAYEGKIVAGAKDDDEFTGEKLVMHVQKCDQNNIRIPFLSAMINPELGYSVFKKIIPCS